MRDTIVFDLDGTLADTAGDLIAAANVALRVIGQDAVLQPGADDATAFRGGRAMLRLAAKRLGRAEDTEMIEAAYPFLLEAYGAALDVHTTLYPGTCEALDRLRTNGYGTAVCTNKPVAFAIDMLDRYDLSHRFDAIVGAGTLAVSKPDPAPYVAAVERSDGTVSRSLLVGDTITDQKTAAAAGVPCILVAFGPTGRAVEDLGPDAVLDHYDDIDGLITQLLP